VARKVALCGKNNVLWFALILSYFAIDSLTGMRYILASASGCGGQEIFENKQSAFSPSAISQINGKTKRKNGFDKTVIRLSNGGSTFVCNKTSIPGWVPG
jgi:hypothetical protein